MAPIDPSLLLGQRAWLRALALDLVGDPHEADDVVQDTWLAALERPPRARDEVGVRAWLGAVARNLVHARRRSAGRRVARERRSAREERTASTAEALERAALQRELVTAVMDLEPPERELVVLRYFEALPPRAIAARLGLSSAAVRSRLSRALAALRARLDRAHDGDRRAWAVVAAGLAGREATALGVLGALTGGIAMSKAAKIVLATALVVAFLGGAQALLAPTPGSDAPPAARSTALPRPELEREALAGGALAATGRVALAADAIEGDEAARRPVRVRFVDSSGRPLADVSVESNGTDARERAQSGPDGWAELELLDPPTSGGRPVDAVYLEFVRSGSAAADRQVELDADGPIELGEVVLGPGGSVAGRVLATGGRPAAGAQVWIASPDDGGDARSRETLLLKGGRPLGPPTVWTDARGRYALRGVPATTVQVWARLDGHLCASTPPLAVRAGDALEAPELHLEPVGPERRIAGRVRTPDGTPCTRFDVRLETPEGKTHDRAVVDDPAGVFALTGGRGIAYALEVRDRDGRYAPLRREGVRAGSTDVELHFERPARPPEDPRPSAVLRGVVRAGGEPVPGARVHAHPAATADPREDPRALPIRAEATTCGSTTTGPDGAFVLPLEATGDLVVHAEREGDARAEARASGLCTGEQRFLDLDLPTGGRLEGRVLVAAGRTAAGATVVASNGDGHCLRTSADAEGGFAFAPLAPGTWEVHRADPARARNAPDYRSLRFGVEDLARVEVLAGTTATLVLDHRDRIPVHLRGSFLIDGRPLPLDVLRVSSRSDVHSTLLDPDGRFDLRLPASGEHTLLGLSELGPGVRVYVSLSADLEPPEVDLDVALEGAALEVRGLPTGPEAASSLVLVRAGDDPVAWEARLEWSPHGRVAFDPIPAGRFELRRWSTATGVLETFELAPGERRVLDLDD